MSSHPLRPARIGEASQVARVHAVSSEAAAAAPVAGQPPASPPMSLEKRTAFWREAIEFSEPQVHVALEGDEVIGFVGFDRSRDPKSKPVTGEIWALYVLPSHWGRGIGLALWDAAREGLAEEGCTEVTAWLALGNERAQRFAMLAGFKRELNTARTALVGGVKLEEIRLKRPLD